MATQLASGYIELTVKQGKAIEGIKKDLLGLDKTAKKAGDDAGEALSKSMMKSAKMSPSDTKRYFNPFERSAKKAGTEAGEELNEGLVRGAKVSSSDARKALRGFEQGASAVGKDAGRSLNESLVKSANVSSSDVKTALGAFGDAKAQVSGIGSEIGGSITEAIQSGMQGSMSGVGHALMTGLAAALPISGFQALFHKRLEDSLEEAFDVDKYMSGLQKRMAKAGGAEKWLAQGSGGNPLVDSLEGGGLRGRLNKLSTKLNGPMGDIGKKSGFSFAKSFEGSMSSKLLVAGGVGAAGFTAAAVAVAAVAAAAAAAVFASTFSDGIERDVQKRTLQVKTGLDPASANQVFRQAEQAYAGGFGASLQENVDTATRLIQSNLVEANSPELQKMIEQVDTLGQVAGVSSEEVAKAATSMVNSGIVDTFDQAMDILVKGQQKGLNASGDLLETFNEYSVQFEKVGLSAEDALGLMNQLMENGARNSDIAADAIKEFSIRSVDGSELTNKALADLGFNWEEMSAKLANPETAREGLQQIITRLSQMEEGTKKTQLQVALFGTQSEDLGDSLNHLNLDTAVNGLGEVDGAAKKASDTLGSGPTAGFEKLGRQVEIMKGQFGDFLVSAIGPMAAKVAELAQKHMPDLIRVFGTVLQVGGRVFLGIIRAIGLTIMSVGQFVDAITGGIGYVLKAEAALQRLLGNEEEAKMREEQADKMFGYGESIEAAGQKMVDFSDNQEHLFDGLGQATERMADAAEVSRDLGDSLTLLPDKQTITVKDNSPETIEKLKRLGLKIEEVVGPDGKRSFKVVADTEEGKAKLEAWRAEEAGEPVVVPVDPQLNKAAAEEYNKKLQKWIKDVQVGVDPGAMPTLDLPGGGPGPEPGGYQGMPGSFASSGLMPNALSLGSQIASSFPNMAIGGKRSDPHPDHPSGKALDVMVGDNPQGKALGDRLFGRYIGDPRVKSIIWQQTYYLPSENYSKKMASLGNRTADHYDHLHILTKKLGGGIPGFGGGDKIPALLEAGEHVFDKDDVKAMGGQSAVYKFRNMLSAGMNPFRFGGGVLGFQTGGQVPDWDRIAMAESGGNWSIDHGDADSTGGLQIQKRTWDNFNGPALTGKEFPYQATKAQQIMIAEKILAVQGPGAWAGGKNFFWKDAGATTSSTSTTTGGTTAEQRSSANAEATQAQTDLDVALAERDEMAKDEAYTTEAVEERNKRLAEKDAEIASLRRARDTAKATADRIGSYPLSDEEDPVIAAEEDARQQQLILEQEMAKLEDLKKSGAVQSEIIKQQGVIDQQQIKVNDAQAAITTARTEATDAATSEMSSYNADNPYYKIMEGLKEIIPSPSALADIGLGGLKETFLPPGFSDPQEWGITQAASGLLGFIGGLVPGPAGYVLRGLGAGVGGDAGGMVDELMGGFLPAPFGDVPWEIDPATGQVRTGIPGQTEEQFAASRHGGAAVAGPGAPVGPPVPGQGTGPPPGPTTVVDASIHMGDVNKGDGAQVVQKASNQQAANTRPNFGTRRV